ncbi:hypothetical protein CVS37_26060 [Burkholderia lata]|nr:hypothetical protein CVS37_26060 [Burkholderia lata]
MRTITRWRIGKQPFPRLIIARMPDEALNRTKQVGQPARRQSFAEFFELPCGMQAETNRQAIGCRQYMQALEVMNQDIAIVGAHQDQSGRLA